MRRGLDTWGLAIAGFALASLVAALLGPQAGLGWLGAPVSLAALLALIVVGALLAWRQPFAPFLLLPVVVFGCAVTLIQVHGPLAGETGLSFWLFVFGLWAAAWRGIDLVAAYRSLDPGKQRLVGLLVPMAFGLWLVYLWEAATVGFGVPQVLLPPPSAVAERFAGSLDILWQDFRQTFLKAVLAGYVIGCGSGFLVSILVDRVPFLQRGLLPLGNLVSALPIVGIAPIMVMWFGFDWQSKAAVVVIMTFFPMLVNTVTGLAAAGALERELMRSYAAGYWPTLFKLRLPAALPFIFNALKINSTLALIGAIVAEFFGTPIVGMGFRISTEVGRMNVDMVWAEIVVAALVGSAFYGLIAVIERGCTFWHPSYRVRR